MNAPFPRIDRSFAGLRPGLGFAAIALLTVASDVVSAQSSSTTSREIARVTVPLTDLDLSTAEGERTAYARLASAAVRACNRFSDSRRVANIATLRDRAREALNDALVQMKRRQLQVRRESTSAGDAPRSEVHR